MCGIIGYIGNKKALPIILDGLRRMEYRGYDSAGIAVLERESVFSQKSVGQIGRLQEKLHDADTHGGTIGIGHTRWATHGGVTVENAHPHTDCTGAIWVVHNGIIENERELKDELQSLGHVFRSETDTETLPHLIEEMEKKYPEENLAGHVRRALLRIKGTYGIAVIHASHPDMLIAARNFSPLLLGIGTGEYFIASDASAILAYTDRVIYLDDGELAILTPNTREITNLQNVPSKKDTHTIEWSLEDAGKKEYPHFMLKEIFEEPAAIENSIRGRIIADTGQAKFGGLSEHGKVMQETKRILIVACGTAYFAGRVGEYLIEEYAGIPVEVDIASEFRYRKPVFRQGDVCLVISQSGETADTLAALREAKAKGIPVIGIVNVVGSTIARETDAGIYQHIGPEMGVASTKAFTSQVAILALLTVLLGRSREMSFDTGRRMLQEIEKIPEHMRHTLLQSTHIRHIAKKYQPYRNFLFLGRKYQMPVACEGALKLKEISYVHAEGYGAGELKHGSIAMIDKDFPSICIVLRDSMREKMISNIQEIKARNGPIIAIATEGDSEVASIADDVIFIPETLEALSPMISAVPLQLFAYHFGVLAGCDVDKPRNLAKSVTVE
ncbi:MAG: glutamine--fructose-6-phosphate transaminase (isomerizing) [Candidatus Sungbacteria bacterium]|nr:glutamine--fructose-6-phosphate transaminase (isomerizing) [Candidatus Sungbacteria bacterium]